MIVQTNMADGWPLYPNTRVLVLQALNATQASVQAMALVQTSAAGQLVPSCGSSKILCLLISVLIAAIKIPSKC